jgi:hypothetical protein
MCFKVAIIIIKDCSQQSEDLWYVLLKPNFHTIDNSTNTLPEYNLKWLEYDPDHVFIYWPVLLPASLITVCGREFEDAQACPNSHTLSHLHCKLTRLISAHSSSLARFFHPSWPLAFRENNIWTHSWQSNTFIRQTVVLGHRTYKVEPFLGYIYSRWLS